MFCGLTFNFRYEYKEKFYYENNSEIKKDNEKGNHQKYELTTSSLHYQPHRRCTKEANQKAAVLRIIVKTVKIYEISNLSQMANQPTKEQSAEFQRSLLTVQ